MRAPNDEGFTLVELLVVMVLIGVLASVGAYGFTAVQRSLDARGAHREAVADLRRVQALAIGQDVAYCVNFGGSTGTTWTVYRVPGADTGTLSGGFSCTSGTQVSSYKAPGSTTFSNVSFQQRNGSFTTYLLFYARGAASGGAFKIGGGGGSTYTISVDNLTGRVASSGA